MSDMYKYIGEKIRELRGDISQEKLSKELDIAANKLSRWETGTYKPSAEDLDAIAQYFKVPITIFFPNSIEDDRISALTSATGGLGDIDFEEVLKYAQFRKAQIELNKEKKKK